MGSIKYSTVPSSLNGPLLLLVGAIVSACGGSTVTDNELAIGAAVEDTVTTGIAVTTEDAGTVGLANCAVLAGSGTLESIVGLYDDSQDGDTNYFHIASNGTTTVYDYQQDEIAQGDNCYLVHSGEKALSLLGGDRYLRLSYIDSDNSCQTETEILTIARNGSEIGIGYIDNSDEDGDGDSFDTVTDNHSLLVGLSVESFNPCE